MGPMGSGQALWAKKKAAPGPLAYAKMGILTTLAKKLY